MIDDGEARLFPGDATGRALPPGVKGYLFSLNLQLDWVIGKMAAIYWAFDPIIHADPSTEIERSVLALEDRHFLRHYGFEFRSLLRVLRQAITLKRVGGVSTIEQQLVRTIVGRRERTVRRKFREIILAILVSLRISKVKILRCYMSTAYLGYRLRGCDEAAQTIFGKPAPHLSLEESAVVASLLVYPVPRPLVEVFTLKEPHTVDQFWELVSERHPAWAKKVRRRYNYCLKIRSKSKKPFI